MIGMVIVGSIHFMLLDFLSFIFSIRLCGTISPPIPSNLKRGFYSILNSSLRYRFNYWMIIIHLIIFEQELIIALLWILAWLSLNSNNLSCLSLALLFMELFLDRIEIQQNDCFFTNSIFIIIYYLIIF